MIESFRSLFLLVALVATSAGWGGCAASSDDDDDVGADGDADADGDSDPTECNPLVCDADGEMCCDTGSGDESCIATNTSFQHCGACSDPCDATQANLCVGGECACGQGGGACAGTPDDLCCSGPGGAACIDTRSNAEACGACNNNCVAPGTTEEESDRCTDGACACGTSGEICGGGIDDTCCPEANGDATCHDVLSDIDNCGGCALADRADNAKRGYVRGDGVLDSQYACAPELSNICTFGHCVCGIPPEIGIDPAPCLGGRASTCCVPENQADADLAICADLDTSELHCGVCNNPCAKNETCLNGVCVD